jgi:hypothetical protein
VLYASCKKRNDKKKITESIVTAMREIGGRFIDKGPEGWFEIDPDKVYEKVSQALREGRPKIRKKLDTTTDSEKTSTPSKKNADDSIIPSHIGSSTTKNISIIDPPLPPLPPPQAVTMDITSGNEIHLPSQGVSAHALEAPMEQENETPLYNNNNMASPQQQEAPRRQSMNKLCWPSTLPSDQMAIDPRVGMVMNTDSNMSTANRTVRRASSILSCTMDYAQHLDGSLFDMSIGSFSRRNSSVFKTDPMHASTRQSQLSQISIVDLSSFTGLEDLPVVDDMMIGLRSSSGQQLPSSGRDSIRSSLLMDDSLIGLVSTSYKSYNSDMNMDMNMSTNEEYIALLKSICRFRSALARYVVHYIVYASSVCSHVNCWLHFFRFERLDSLLCARILNAVTRYYDSFVD